MRTVAHCAEAVESWNAQRGGEISVRAATDGAFAQGKIHLFRERLRAGEESRAHFAFERRTVETAGDFKASSPIKWPQSVQSALQVAHVGDAKGAQIEYSARAFRDDVGPRAAFDDAGVDGDAAAKIIPSFDARELPRQLVDSVDPFLRRKTRMRGAAMHDQFSFTGTLAGRLQKAARAEGRLEDEDRIAAARFGFKNSARRFAADLLVGSPEEDDAFAKRHIRVVKRLQREKCLNDSRLHVKGSRAVSFAAFQSERHLCEGPGRVHRIVMAEDEELAGRARFTRRMSNVEKIAAMFLCDSIHAHVEFIPFLGDDAAATIGGGFFQAGRFRSHESAQRREHLRQTRLQEAQKLLGGMGIRHGADMLTMARKCSNLGSQA